MSGDAAKRGSTVEKRMGDNSKKHHWFDFRSGQGVLGVGHWLPANGTGWRVLLVTLFSFLGGFVIVGEFEAHIADFVGCTMVVASIALLIFSFFKRTKLVSR